MSSLPQIQDHKHDVDILFGQTFVAPTSAQLAETIPCQPGEVADGESITGSTGRLGLTNAGNTTMAEEECCFQQGAKPKAYQLRPGHSGGTRSGCHHSPPPGFLLSNRCGALGHDFPPAVPQDCCPSPANCQSSSRIPVDTHITPNPGMRPEFAEECSITPRTPGPSPQCRINITAVLWKVICSTSSRSWMVKDALPSISLQTSHRNRSSLETPLSGM